MTAIQDMINRGVKGISLDPANAAALVPIVQEARDAGILVVAVNTETDPADAVAATFETDNFAGGVLMGQWAKAKLGDTPARVALLDYDLTDKTSKARHDGFLSGFGLTEDSPEIAGSIQTQANADSGTHGHGEPALGQPRHQRRLHHQRADGGRSRGGDRGGRP